MNNRSFVIGDIHGAYKALLQCLQRSRFDYENDNLICLGDVADGWPDTRLCIEELLKVKHLTYVMGNHDWWALKWMEDGFSDSAWLLQGGEETIRSYNGIVIQDHKEFLRNALPYFIKDNRLFIHAGFDPSISLEDQSIEIFFFDRNLAKSAIDAHLSRNETKLTEYDEVYIGHTPVSRLGSLKPVKSCEIWLMDTGAGWDGVLSMMDIQTKELFSSDSVPSLYPDAPGRINY